MLFPDFTGVRSLDWLFFVARLGGKRADRLAQKTQSKTFAW